MKTLSLCNCSVRRRPFVTPRLRKSTSQVPSQQDSVSCVYKSEPVSSSSSREELLITLTWTRDLVCRGFDLELLNARSKSGSRCAYQLRKVKGYCSFGFDGSRIEVLWNLSAAEYDNGCEPGGQFYMMMAVDSELCLKLCNNTSSGLSKTSCFSRRERFSGSTFYSTKANFCDSGKEHDIAIKCVKEMNESGAESPLFLLVLAGRWSENGVVLELGARCGVFIPDTERARQQTVVRGEEFVEQSAREFSLVISGCKMHQAKSWG